KQARCVGDEAIGRRLWQFLQPDGYPRTTLELEHAVAAVCDRISTDDAPFDVAEAELLPDRWQVRRAVLEPPLHDKLHGVKTLNARPQIGVLLEARGWGPEKRTEKPGRAVIDDDVLEELPAIYPEFTGLAEHYVLGRRLGQLANGERAWISNVGSDG